MMVNARDWRWQEFVFFCTFNSKNEKSKLLSHWLCFFSTEVHGGQISTQVELLHDNSSVIYTTLKLVRSHFIDFLHFPEQHLRPAF